MKRILYNSDPLQQKAAELSAQRGISAACRKLDLSRTQFYAVVKGESASYPTLLKVARFLGVPKRGLGIRVEGENEADS